MTQEEKARRYDEAYKKVAVRFGSNVADEIFLKESEDERIRKAIINVFVSHKDYEVFFGASVEDILAWLKKQGEQKPAWSEEDEKMLRDIIDDFSEELDEWTDKEEIEIITNKISFLKSLKPHPIHKWNREDNKTRFEITNYLECQKKEEPTRTDILNKWIAWIANLDPQGKQGSQWKPSDEMLEALYRVIPNNVMEISEDEMLLNKLYQGLKYGKVLSEK